MSPYNTRSEVRRQALEPYTNAVVSPSATGQGIHIRWNYPPNEEIPTFESEASTPHPTTPDQDGDSEFQRSPTACSIEITDERASPVVEDVEYSAADRAFAERMLAELKQQKEVVEEHAARLLDPAKAQGNHPNPQANSNRSGDSSTVGVFSGPKLPVGVIGLGRTGTWVVDELWRPEIVPSTNQLPSVREAGEAEVVENPLPNDATQEDLGERDARLRMLTPLPSFVGGGTVQMTG